MSGFLPRVLRVHQWIYEHSGGLIGHRLMFGNRTLLLHTTGRRSGLPRSSALSYAHDGNAYLIVASNGGGPKAPAWEGNLKAHPKCEIQIGRRRIPVTATVTLPENPDYARRWAMVDRNTRGLYTQYQRKTQRVISIVELHPAS